MGKPRPVYDQVFDALRAEGFDVELDVFPDLDEHKVIVGSSMRLSARRRADGQVAAASHWTPLAEHCARSLVTNMLMIAEPDVRAVVDKVQI